MRAMLLGRIPGLALDRTGVALLGAILLLEFGRIDIEGVRNAIDMPTIALLLAFMVMSSQFRLSGFYTRVAEWIGRRAVPPPHLLAILMACAALLSALLCNDIICLAMAPILLEGCLHRGLNPKPFLIGLACAANIGSAATLIGNPQNMLIGQILQLSFVGYILTAAVPVLLGLAVAWLIICGLTRSDWHAAAAGKPVSVHAFNSWQTMKGLLVLSLVVGAFLFLPWPREIAALAGAAVLLCSRRMHSREMLGLVDWQLILLFISLFIVNHVLQAAGMLDHLFGGLARTGLDPQRPGTLFSVVVVLSNLVSNVPAVMLLLPLATHPLSGPILALGSTLAGNLFIVGSIANIIVVEQAAGLGVRISWREHARIGLPVTLATLAIAALWLALWHGFQPAG